MPTSYLKQWTERRQRGYTQFPQEVTGPVTIYPQYTDLLTGNQIAVRCVLQNCFWNDDSIAVWQRTGQQTSNSVSLYIPYAEEVTGRKYVSPNEWNNLPIDRLDSHWAADPLQLPIMLKGVSEHEFFWAHPTNTAITPANDRLTMQINRFRTANNNVRTARDINVQAFGTRDMWHIEIRC